MPFHEFEPSDPVEDFVSADTCRRCGVLQLNHLHVPENSRVRTTMLGRENPVQDKEDLVAAITELIGHEPAEIRRILKVLAHPALIEQTVQFFSIQDTSSMCTKYEAPWNCAREAEALYENIQYGWLGGVNGIGFSEWWCENCRKKVIGNG